MSDQSREDGGCPVQLGVKGTDLVQATGAVGEEPPTQAQTHTHTPAHPDTPSLGLGPVFRCQQTHPWSQAEHQLSA